MAINLNSHCYWKHPYLKYLNTCPKDFSISSWRVIKPHERFLLTKELQELPATPCHFTNCKGQAIGKSEFEETYTAGVYTWLS